MVEVEVMVCMERRQGSVMTQMMGEDEELKWRRKQDDLGEGGMWGRKN